MVKIGFLSSAVTISTRVLWKAPPDTRKLAYGFVTLNGTEVSVPLRALPPTPLLTQYVPEWPRTTLLRSAPPSGRPSPLTTWKASPEADQLSSVPDSKSRSSARPPTSGGVPGETVGV